MTRTSYRSKRASRERPMAVYVRLGRPVLVGVAADDHAVNNGDEVPVKKRHAPSWFSGQECSERVDIGRVKAVDPEALQSNRELLVRDAAVRPSVGGNVEGIDESGLGNRRHCPVQGRQGAVVLTVTYLCGACRMPVAHHN